MARDRIGRSNPHEDVRRLRTKTLPPSGGAGGAVTDHGVMSGLGDDDHGQYIHISVARTITATHIFDIVQNFDAGLRVRDTADTEVVKLEQGVAVGLGRVRLGSTVSGSPWSIEPSTNLFDGVTDPVFFIGSNVGSQGTRLDTADATVHLGFEHNYRWNSNNYVESYLQMTSTGGTTRRYLAFTIDRVNPDNFLKGHLLIDPVGSFSFLKSSDSALLAQFVGDGSLQFGASGNIKFLAANPFIQTTINTPLALIANGKYVWLRNDIDGFGFGSGNDVDLYRGGANQLRTSDALQVDGTLTALDDFRVGTNLIFADVSQGNVGINRAPDLQFDLDVNGNFRAGGYIVGRHAIQLDGALMICHYDGLPPVETNFTGDATGHLGQVATLKGGVCYRPGMFNGKGLQISDVVANLITNPSGEVNTTGWSVWFGTGSPSISASTEDAYIGLRSFKVTAGTSGVVYVSNVMAVANGKALTYSARVKSATGVTCQIELLNYNTGASLGAVSVPGNDDWQYPITTYSNGSGGSVNVIAAMQVNGAGNTGYFDALQATKSVYALPYGDGSLGGYSATGVSDGSGHYWAGTAHASASHRLACDAAYVATNNIKPALGTIMLWTAEVAHPAMITGGPLAILFDANGTGSSSLLIWRDTANNRVYARVTNDAGTQYTVTSAALDWTVDHHVVMTWGANDVRLYIDGASVGTPITSAVMPTTLGTVMKVGLQSNIAQRYANMVIDDLVILKRKTNDGEVRAVYESNAPVFAETSTWTWRVGANLVWGDTEGLWVIDASGQAAFGVSGVNGKAWGGLTLDAGDVLLGRGTAYARWDDSAATFEVRGTIKADTGYLGALDVSGKLSMSGVDGAIAIGTTPPTSASAGTGIWIDRTGYYGLNAGAYQVKIDATDGKLYAGGGNIVIAETGLLFNGANQLIEFVNNTAHFNFSWDTGESTTMTVSGANAKFFVNMDLKAKIFSTSGDHAAASTPFYLVAAASQSAEIFRIVDNGEDDLVAVDNAGNMAITQNLLIGAGAAGLTQGVITAIETTTGPTAPGAGDRVRLYMKDDKLVLQFYDAGTVRYKFLDLTGTGVTWVHTTSAP